MRKLYVIEYYDGLINGYRYFPMSANSVEDVENIFIRTIETRYGKNADIDIVEVYEQVKE